MGLELAIARAFRKHFLNSFPKQRNAHCIVFLNYSSYLYIINIHKTRNATNCCIATRKCESNCKMSEDAQWRERSRSPIPRVVSQRSRSPAPVHHDRERQRSRSFERRAPRRAPAEHPQVDPSEHLSFFNLERGLNEEDLEREVMDVVGYHCRFTIARDAKTRTSKGFGFVKLESVDDAIRVKEALHDKVR
jgi:RNA recognition motif-containing protein